MSDIFAKLFDVQGGQVLISLEETDEGDPSVRMRTDYRGVSYAMNMAGWEGDDAHQRAEKVLDGLTAADAEKFRASAATAIDEVMG